MDDVYENANFTLSAKIGGVVACSTFPEGHNVVSITRNSKPHQFRNNQLTAPGRLKLQEITNLWYFLKDSSKSKKAKELRPMTNRFGIFLYDNTYHLVERVSLYNDQVTKNNVMRASRLQTQMEGQIFDPMDPFR